MAIGGAVAFACWQGISSAWADEPNAALTAMNRSLLYAAAFSLVVIILRRARSLRMLSIGALAVIAVVGGWAVGSRVIPSVVPGDHGARLATGFSYWNALGILLTFGLVLAIGLAAHRALPRWGAAAAGACVPLLVVGIVLTSSRGAVVGCLVGAIVLIAAAPHRIETICAVISTGLITTPVVIWVITKTSLAPISGIPQQNHRSGFSAAALLVITMALAGAAAWGLATFAARLVLRPAARYRIGWGIAGVSAVFAVILAGANWPAGGPVAFLGRQFDAFRALNIGERTQSGNALSALATTAGTGRWQNWTVAVHEAGAAPLQGTGTGDYQFWWDQTRPIGLVVQNAHSLYLETLGESGLIGLALLLVPIATAAIVGGRFLVRTRGRSMMVSRDIAVALAACSALLVHAGIDWDWQFPTVMLPGVVLTAGIVAVASGSAARAKPATRTARSAVAVASALALLMALPIIVSARTLEGAFGLAARGEMASAAADARKAAAENPQDPAPWLLLANVEDDQRQFTAANASYAAALVRSPRSNIILADWTYSLLRQGDTAGARQTLEAARIRNPLDPRIAVLASELEQQAAG